MKATSLEQISTDYCFVMEQKEVALATLQQKEQVRCVAIFSARLAQLVGHLSTFSLVGWMLKSLPDHQPGP